MTAEVYFILRLSEQRSLQQYKPHFILILWHHRCKAQYVILQTDIICLLCSCIPVAKCVPFVAQFPLLV